MMKQGIIAKSAGRESSLMITATLAILRTTMRTFLVRRGTRQKVEAYLPYLLSAFRFKSLLSNLHTACKSDGLCPGLRKHRRHAYPLSSSARR